MNDYERQYLKSLRTELLDLIATAPPDADLERMGFEERLQEVEQLLLEANQSQAVIEQGSQSIAALGDAIARQTLAQAQAFQEYQKNVIQAAPKKQATSSQAKKADTAPVRLTLRVQFSQQVQLLEQIDEQQLARDQHLARDLSDLIHSLSAMDIDLGGQGVELDQSNSRVEQNSLIMVLSPRDESGAQDRFERMAKLLGESSGAGVTGQVALPENLVAWIAEVKPNGTAPRDVKQILDKFAGIHVTPRVM